MKIKVRLRRTHYLNGQKKVAGNVIRLDEFSAKWLIDRRIADPVQKPKQ